MGGAAPRGAARRIRRRPGPVLAVGLALGVLAGTFGGTFGGMFGIAPAAGSPAGRPGQQQPANPSDEGSDEGGRSGPDGWLVADAGTGVVLAGENIHEPLPPASTIKLLSALAVLERVRVDETATISDAATGTPETNIGVEVGETWRVGDLLAAMVLAAANDATVALAERTAGGDLEAFDALVAETAVRIGLRETTVTDPTGVDSSLGDAATSAYDLAVVARNVLAVPELAALVAQEQVDDAGPEGATRPIANDNPMLGRYDGANGMRVGATDAGGRTIVASATRGDRTVIAVGLGVGDWYAWASDALDRGFAADPAAAAGAETLPPAKAVSVDTRNTVALALPSVLGRPTATVSATATAPTPAPTTTAAPTEATAAGERAATPTSGGGGGVPWAWVLVLVVALVVVAFFARRAQVKRRRQRRLTRLRGFDDARRRGMITVIGDRPAVRGSGHVRVVRPAAPRGTPSRSARRD